MRYFTAIKEGIVSGLLCFKAILPSMKQANISSWSSELKREQRKMCKIEKTVLADVAESSVA